jgi:hypothetical protein
MDVTHFLPPWAMKSMEGRHPVPQNAMPAVVAANHHKLQQRLDDVWSEHRQYVSRLGTSNRRHAAASIMLYLEAVCARQQELLRSIEDHERLWREEQGRQRSLREPSTSTAGAASIRWRSIRMAQGAESGSGLLGTGAAGSCIRQGAARRSAAVATASRRPTGHATSQECNTGAGTAFAQVLVATWVLLLVVLVVLCL